MSSTLTMTQGDVREATITIRDPDGTPTDLTDKRVLFTAKKERLGSAFVFQKSSADGGIVIADPATGVGVMVIEEADTEDLPSGTILDCIVTLDDNPGNRQTAYKGTLTVDWGIGA